MHAHVHNQFLFIIAKTKKIVKPKIFNRPQAFSSHPSQPKIHDFNTRLFPQDFPIRVYKYRHFYVCLHHQSICLSSSISERVEKSNSCQKKMIILLSLCTDFVNISSNYKQICFTTFSKKKEKLCL